MYTVPQFVSFVLEHADRVLRWDLLQANFIANDPRVKEFRGSLYITDSRVIDNAFDEMDAINNPVFSEETIEAFGQAFVLANGPTEWMLASEYGRKALSSVRLSAAVEYLLQRPELIEHDEFVANPVAIEHIERRPGIIRSNRAITRNPAALPLLMANPQYIDWGIFCGVWYIGDSGSRRSSKKRNASRAEEQPAKKRN